MEVGRIVFFSLVVASEVLINTTAGMNVCEFEKKFPDSTDSCFKNQVSAAKSNATFKDCMDVFNVSRTSGVYTIKPKNWPGPPFSVYCNMTDGGGWTVFQRRVDGSVDFFLDWSSYKNGFGNVSYEHWLGNEKLYYLANQRTYQIRIDLVNRDGDPYYAKYSSFRISNEADNYNLIDVGTYSGTADLPDTTDGFALTHHQGYQFSTKDRDHDSSTRHCASANHCYGGWWYDDCCYSNLNGFYNAPIDRWSSIFWYHVPGSDSYGRNLKFSEMKLRPV